MEFLCLRGAVNILEIRFCLDGAHGIVYSKTQVLRVLEALERKGELRLTKQGNVNSWIVEASGSAQAGEAGKE